MVAGVPAHVDGRMLAITEAAGGRVDQPRPDVALRRGLHNWDPVWREPRHPDPARPVVALARRPRAAAARAAVPRLRHPRHARAPHARPATTTPGSCSRRRSSRRSSRSPAPSRTRTSPARASGRCSAAHAAGAPGPGRGVQADTAPTSSSRTRCPSWSRGMNALVATSPRSTSRTLERADRRARPRDRQPVHARTPQITAIRGARRYRGDRLIRVAEAAPPARPEGRPAHRGPAQHPDPQDARRAGDRPRRPRAARRRRARSPGLYAAGEVAGFGGGGMHGYRALEGTFLGGCLFSGRAAGRALAAAL